MPYNLGLGLRALALVFTIIITGLIGNVIARDVRASSSARAAVDLAMFAAALSWVVCLYGLVAAAAPSFSLARRPLVGAGLEALGCVFAFVAAVVLAARIGAPNCADTWGRRSDWIAYGSRSAEGRCRQLQAADAFFWFLTAVLGVAAVESWRVLREGGRARGSGPAMMQV